VPEVADFETTVAPTWCPGCGNFGMWRAMKQALARLGLEHHEFAVVYGIGCHGNGADFLRCQSLHALHGRALPPAQGIALTNPDIKVLVESGDGDGYGIGLGHFVHACRRNVDLTYVSHNNQIYGLTTGQVSPTSEHHMKTISTPSGVLEWPVNPTGLAIAQGATFVARGFAGDIDQLEDLIVQAVEHRGFAVVDVFQPCVTFNKINTFGWFRDRVYKLEEEDGYDPSDKQAAFAKSLSTFHDLVCTPEECTIPTGVFYREQGADTYQDGTPQLDGPMWRRATEPRDIGGVLDAFRP
jgi:2-oxoglutarate ferredoxin oxidoreductase subunit beta